MTRLVPLIEVPATDYVLRCAALAMDCGDYGPADQILSAAAYEDRDRLAHEILVRRERQSPRSKGQMR
ncbi:hypothetical protein [Streptomyces daliensis]